VQLTATATLTAAGRGRRGRKASVSTLALGRAAATLQADKPAGLAVEPGRGTLARLRRAAARGERIAVTLTLLATNAHGTSRASAKVRSLKL